jgi:hypothetical protein
MKQETMLQRWQEWQPSKAQACWLTAGAVIVTLVAGFGPGGWVTGGKAQQLAAGAAESARTELAVAVCMEEFMDATNAKARLSKLQAASWMERSDLLAKAGWATMPDRKEPDDAVAVQCAARLAGN